MFAARLPALACGLAIMAFTLAHEAAAVEQAPIRANTVLLAGATSTTSSETSGSSRATRPSTQGEDESTEDWTEPRRFLLGFAALFIFLAYRRRDTE